MLLVLPASAQQKPFTQAQVSSMVQNGFGDESGVRLIEQRGIDFAPAEDFLQSLKAAGASESFLRALRAATSPVSGGSKKPMGQVEVVALLTGQTISHRVAQLVQRRGVDFKPTDEYLQEVRQAGGEDELVIALKNARVTKPKHVDPGLQARQAEACHHAARGAGLMRQQRYADAAEEDRAAIQLAPQASDLHLSLAWALAANNDLNSAIDECREAVRLNLNNDVAHLLLGHALASGGDAEGEIAEYRAALRANPDNTLAHVYLGLALGRRQDWEGAIVQYRGALRVDANDPTVHPNFGPEPARKDDQAGVIADSRRALRLNPNPENAHLNLGLALGMDGDWDGAIAEERAVISTNPNNALAHYLLGLAFEAKTNPQDAVQEYRVACALDPNNRDFREAYERLRGQQNR
jgi:tetratricopeptide (TPR) repeat protein